MVKAVVLAANQYHNNQSDSNLVQLQRQLDVSKWHTTKDKILHMYKEGHISLVHLVSSA